MIFKLPYQAEIAKKQIDAAKEGFICDIRRAKKPRSQNQNSYYWGVVVKAFSQEFGYHEHETHQLFGNTYLTYVKNDIQFIRSTTELTTVEMENYLSQCRQYASENGLYIPEPNEVDETYINQLEAWRF